MNLRKECLKHTLAEDLKRFGNKRPGVKDLVLHNEVWYIYSYIRHLRFIEYYGAKIHSGRVKFWYSIPYLCHWLRYKRLGFKLNFTIYPNCVGPGFRIYHAGGFVHVGPQCKIGKNCTLLPGVVFGNKHEKVTGEKIIVGDNCYFGLGAKIFGSVRIGNNVTVGANAVVTKDIPDNAVVGGVPAKIIRIKTDIKC